MASLIFLLTVLILLILGIGIIINVIRHKPFGLKLKLAAVISVVYSISWIAFNLLSKDVPVALGTDICFDDWCAAVTQIDNGPAVQKQFERLHTDSTWIVLTLKMSNHARGIAQKPSEPRVHIIDAGDKEWARSKKGQELLEQTAGAQPGIGQRLELRQSLETKLVFAVPVQSTGLKVLIEEGPFITNLLFPDDRQVFLVP